MVQSYVHACIAPKFEDANCEAEYECTCLEQITKRGSNICRIFMTVLVIALSISLVTMPFFSAVRPQVFLRLSTTAFLAILLGVYSVFLDKVPQCAAPWYNSLMFTAAWLYSFDASLTMDRMEALSGLDEAEQSYRGGLMEAKTTTQLLALLVAYAFLTRTSPGWVFMWIHAAVITFFAATTALGSAEHACMLAANSEIGSHIRHSAMLTAWIYIAGLLVYFARRSQDVREREIFWHAISC